MFFLIVALVVILYPELSGSMNSQMFQYFGNLMNFTHSLVFVSIGVFILCAIWYGLAKKNGASEALAMLFMLFILWVGYSSYYLSALAYGLLGNMNVVTGPTSFVFYIILGLMVSVVFLPKPSTKTNEK